MKKHTGTIVTVVVLCIAAVVVVLSTFTIVPSGYVGVKETMGQVSDNMLPSGTYLHIPFIESITKVCTKQIDQFYEQKIWAESSEQTALYMAQTTVTYKLNPEKAPYIVENVANYNSDLVNTTLVSSALKAATRTIETQHVTNRSYVEAAAVEALQRAVDNKYGAEVVSIINININDMDFEESYQAAIADRQLAEQAYQKQAIENKTALEKAEADKQVAITQAQAQAEADKIAAEAQAEIVRIEAEAQAEANEKLANSISDKLVDYKKIEMWDGKLPAVYGSGASAFVDVSDIVGAGEKAE